MDMSLNLLIALVVFAVFLLAFWFLNRRSEKIDTGEISSLRELADKGDAYAQFRLGQIYYEGTAVPRDDREAAAWFSKAASQDHAEAQFILATMYEKGHGVLKNDREAFAWYSRAASLGHERSRVILESGRWDAFGAGQEAARVDDLAEEGALTVGRGEEEQPHDRDKRELFEKYLAKAEAGDANAQYNVGVMYYHGEGVEKDFEKALKWFLLSAQQGDADAQYSLGFMYGRGEGTVKDRAASLEWFQKAASSGHKGALELLEKMRLRS